MIARIKAASVVVALISVLFAGCEKKHDLGSQEHGSAGTALGTSAKVADTVVDGKSRDPVCGMTTEVAGKPESVYRDTKFHFCSTACFEKFKAAPAKQTTGLPGEPCMCSAGDMKNCKCGHCTGKQERCDCGDPKPKEGGDGHDHEHK